LAFLFFFAVSTTGPPATAPTGSSPVPRSASPPLSSESLTFFRTSFQERNVRRRETLAWSWRMRKMRSSVEMDLLPRREACSVHCRSCKESEKIHERMKAGCCCWNTLPVPLKLEYAYHFNHLLPNYFFDHTCRFGRRFGGFTRDVHHLKHTDQ